MVESVSKHPFNFLKAKRIKEDGNHLDKENARRLHILLHNLNEPYKEVFTLRVFGELPFSQIGELFGKTDSWARLIFYRAKKQLQEDLK